MIEGGNSHYRIPEELDSSGIGVVYGGEDSRLARRAACLYSVRMAGSAPHLVKRAKPASPLYTPACTEPRAADLRFESARAAGERARQADTRFRAMRP
jgi:hypothetical protein